MLQTSLSRLRRWQRFATGQALSSQPILRCCLFGSKECIEVGGVGGQRVTNTLCKLVVLSDCEPRLILLGLELICQFFISKLGTCAGFPFSTVDDLLECKGGD